MSAMNWVRLGNATLDFLGRVENEASWLSLGRQAKASDIRS